MQIAKDLPLQVDGLNYTGEKRSIPANGNILFAKHKHVTELLVLT